MEAPIQKIFDKYSIFEDCKLVKYELNQTGVHCWFENKTHVQHRALLYPEFELFFPHVAWPIDYVPVEGEYVY